MHLQRTLKHILLPEELADTTIVVLGLLQMGYTDIAWIADVVLHRRENRSLRRLLRMLKTSRNPTVRQCVDKGLPPGLFRPFPYAGIKVRCPVCRCMVDHAPCPRCSLVPCLPAAKVAAKVAGRSSRSAPSPFDKSHPLDAFETVARPGTMEKLAVMRRRAARGMSVFNPQDR